MLYMSPRPSSFHAQLTLLETLNPPPRLRVEGTVAVRTDGLLGDNIVASTAFEDICRREKNAPLIIFNTYNHDSSRLTLLCDLFCEMINDGIISDILHYPRDHGALRDEERAFLLNLGCRAVYECAPFEKEFLGLSRGAPSLGERLNSRWHYRTGLSGRIALFRWSGFHRHHWCRNRPSEEWLEIQNTLQIHGKTPVLFGWDDPLPAGRGVIDLRRRLSVHETLMHMADCEFLISTTSFPPLFCQHFIQCFVLAAPEDISNLHTRWCVKDSYEMYDVSQDYLNALTERISSF